MRRPMKLEGFCDQGRGTKCRYRVFPIRKASHTADVLLTGFHCSSLRGKLLHCHWPSKKVGALVFRAADFPHEKKDRVVAIQKCDD